MFVVEDALENFARKIARLAKRVRWGTAMHGSSPLYVGGGKLQALGGFDEPLNAKRPHLCGLTLLLRRIVRLALQPEDYCLPEG